MSYHVEQMASPRSMCSDVSQWEFALLLRDMQY